MITKTKKTPKLSRSVLEFHINPEIIDAGLTQSEMQCWDNCSEKWYLGYNLMLSLRGKFSWALTYGGWMHSALEEFYSSKGKRWHIDPQIKDKHFLSAEQLADFDYWQQLAQIQMEIYASYYKSDFKFFKINEGAEKVVSIKFEDIWLHGKIDLYIRANQHKGWYAMDHKTTSKIDRKEILGWDFRLQFMMYCWFAWKLWKDNPVQGIYINAIKKPQLKQGVNEPTRAFLQRVQTDMQLRPEVYFYRERLRLMNGDLQHFEDTILRPKINRVKFAMDPNVPDEVKIAMLRNKNTDHCNHYNRPCEFINCCKNGLAMEQKFFRRREVKHTELEDPE